MRWLKGSIRRTGCLGQSRVNHVISRCMTLSVLRGIVPHLGLSGVWSWNLPYSKSTIIRVMWYSTTKLYISILRLCMVAYYCGLPYIQDLFVEYTRDLKMWRVAHKLWRSVAIPSIYETGFITAVVPVPVYVCIYMACMPYLGLLLIIDTIAVS